jgi:hypothetical protein
MLIAGTTRTCIRERTAPLWIPTNAAAQSRREATLRHFLSLLSVGQAVLPRCGSVSISASCTVGRPLCRHPTSRHAGRGDEMKGRTVTEGRDILLHVPERVKRREEKAHCWAVTALRHEYHISIVHKQSVPHRRHITSPLQSPTG